MSEINNALEWKLSEICSSLCENDGKRSVGLNIPYWSYLGSQHVLHQATKFVET